MVPLVASNAIPTPPPVVNTTLPGTTVAHVPYDNVAPSFSNAEVNNNASNNNTPPAAEQEQASNLSVDEAFANYLTGSAASLPSVNAQAAFLAQLIGQDITVPPETAGILVQYETLNAYANVKYKPSNATKPEEPGPSDAFSRILAEDQPQPVAPPVKAPMVIQVTPAQAAPVKPVAPKPAKGANAYAASAGRIAANSNTVTEVA